MTPSFYMRPLPVSPSLIPYDSARGKDIFKHALESGGLEAFFPLSQQFLTQEEPAYCGIGTLCMVLNALKVDPAKTWRKPWRWFTQDMLDCCRPLEYVRSNGITLSEFTCLAKCNGLEANTKYADKITLDEFRRDIITSTNSSKQLMAVSYSRSSLGQTGEGHFSPVGGYSSLDGGKVLILDVARFKYPSYWVSLEALYESLKPVDRSTGQPRGYSLLRKPDAEGGAEKTYLLRLGFTKATWPRFFEGVARKAEKLEPVATVQDLSRVMTEYVREQYKDIPTPIRTRHETIVPCTPARPHDVPPKAQTKFTPMTGPLSQDATAAAATAAVKLTSNLAYDENRIAASAQEYSTTLSAFFAHLSSTSKIHSIVAALAPPSQACDTEVNLNTILLLALYSFEPFLRRLREGVRGRVGSMVEVDLRDGELRREVGGVRRQIQSLMTCMEEECGPECGRRGECERN